MLIKNTIFYIREQNKNLKKKKKLKENEEVF